MKVDIMRKLTVVLFVTLLAMSFFTALSFAEQNSPWKIGHVRPKGSAIDKDVQRLVERIAKDTGGKITFEVYPASKLGDYSIVQERCSFGEVEMFVGPFGTAVDKKLGLAFTPFLVTDWNKAKEVYSSNGVLMKRMGEFLENQNIKLLGGWPVYFGGIVLSQEPPSPTDPDVSKDMIIRVPPIRSFELTAKSLGYTPYPITWVYALMGLKTGMVEGMMGGGAEGYAGLKDLAKYYLPVKDHFEYWFVYMNRDLWKGLSEEEKTTIQNAVDEMEAKRFEVAEKDEKAALERLKQQGTKIIDISEEDLSKMAEKVRRTVWPTMKKDIGEAFDEVVSSTQN
jgi:TRAP-type C4-dicarboxylate transport system substrate-binding protein